MLKKQFTERVLSSELERKYVPENFEFSRDELLKYYQDHDAQWKVPSRAKWRELSVLFENHSPKEAGALIAILGNQIYLGGKTFDAVAKAQSEGSTAAEGGIFEWTMQGSLQSLAIDQAIFSLPLKRLSKAIESETGFHIVEVLEREPGYTKSFESTEREIQRKLTEEKRKQLLTAFRAKIVAQSKVWTIWPQDIPNSRPLAERQAVEKSDNMEFREIDAKSVQPHLRNWKFRLVDISTGNPVPGIKLRVQSVAKGQQNAQPVKATSNAEGIASVEVVEGVSARVEVVSTDWWQTAPTLLDDDLILKTAENAGEKSQIVDMQVEPWPADRSSD